VQSDSLCYSRKNTSFDSESRRGDPPDFSAPAIITRGGDGRLGVTGPLPTDAAAAPDGRSEAEEAGADAAPDAADSDATLAASRAFCSWECKQEMNDMGTG
jgi:hypothetical protein